MLFVATSKGNSLSSAQEMVRLAAHLWCQ